jgi:hypothetical protein
MTTPKYFPMIIPVSDSKASGDVTFEIYFSTDTTLGTLVATSTHTPALSISTLTVPIAVRAQVMQVTIKVTAGNPLKLSQFNLFYHRTPEMVLKCTQGDAIDAR